MFCRCYHSAMVRKQTRPRSADRQPELATIVRLLSDIDQKFSYLIEQLRKDLYVLVPKQGDDVFGGPVRNRRTR